MGSVIREGGATALIAVVADDRAFRQLMEDLLIEEGYHLRMRPVTEGVVAACMQERPDLLMLDLDASTRDAGVRLLHTLREEVALTDLPVIVCSADTALLREWAAPLAALKCAVVEKPFELDALLTQIATMLTATTDAREAERALSLDVLVAEVGRVLAGYDTLGPDELRMAAIQLRILATVSRAMAQRRDR
jgi:DNA-binding NtrC family response regulator